MPNDSTSARWPLYMLCGQCTGEGCDACAGNGYVPAAIPPSDETPEVSTGTMYRLDDGRMRAMAAHYTKLDADRAPLVDTGAPTAGGAWSDEYHTLDQAVMDAQALPRTDRHIAILTRIRDRFAPPSPEGTGTPPDIITESLIVAGNKARRLLGLSPVAGEIPGVGAATERDPISEITLRFKDYLRRCYHDAALEEFTALEGRAREAESIIAALRLRAEAAERQLATFTQADVGYLNGLASDPFLPHDGKAADLAKRITATLSSQRTL